MMWLLYIMCMTVTMIYFSRIDVYAAQDVHDVHESFDVCVGCAVNVCAWLCMFVFGSRKCLCEKALNNGD